MDVKVEPLKAARPIIVTLFGISIDAREVQPMNAHTPILVTLFGIVTEVRPVQFSKAKGFMPVTL